MQELHDRVLAYLKEENRRPCLSASERVYLSFLQGVAEQFKIARDGIVRQGGGHDPLVKKRRTPTLQEREAKLSKSPYLPWIKKVVAYFHQTHPRPVAATQASLLAAEETLERLLRLHMSATPEPRERLKKIILYIVNDPFWVAQVRTLASLDKKSRNGAPLWENIEAKIELDGRLSGGKRP